MTAEAKTWILAWVETKSDFTQFVADFLPEQQLAPLRAKIETEYPCEHWWDCDNPGRVESVIQDAVFTCNTRYLYDNYHKVTTTLMMQYDFGDTDLYGRVYMDIYDFAN